MAKYKLYEYQWIDHWSKSSWSSPESLAREGPCIIDGVGFLVGETADYWYFASGLCADNGAYNSVMAVLKVALRRKKLLKTVTI